MKDRLQEKIQENDISMEDSEEEPLEKTVEMEINPDT